MCAGAGGAHANAVRVVGREQWRCHAVLQQWRLDEHGVPPVVGNLQHSQILGERTMIGGVRLGNSIWLHATAVSPRHVWSKLDFLGKLPPLSTLRFCALNLHEKQRQDQYRLSYHTST